MYYVVYGFLYLVSLLPLRILYLFSDLAYFLLYYVIRYRRDVVADNLQNAFPDKNEKEITKITKKFYRNFTDNFIEFIKLISASRKFLDRHFTGDYSLPNQLYDQGKKCELLLAHNFNWEMACIASGPRFKHLFLVVYMPIKNKIFNRIFYKMRSKTGAVLLAATNMRNDMAPYRNENYTLVLVADQNPGAPQNAYWVNFLNRPAPFVKGPESGARRSNTPAIFTKFIKLRRGYYKIIFEMGCENPASLKEGEMTKRYVEFLQKFISEYPEMWLWSHRRWKHEWKEQYGTVM